MFELKQLSEVLGEDTLMLYIQTLLSAIAAVFAVSYLLCSAIAVSVLAILCENKRQRNYLIKLSLISPIILVAALPNTPANFRNLRGGRFDPAEKERLKKIRDEIEKEGLAFFGTANTPIEKLLKSDLFFAYVLSANSTVKFLLGDPEKVFARGS